MVLITRGGNYLFDLPAHWRGSGQKRQKRQTDTPTHRPTNRLFQSILQIGESWHVNRYFVMLHPSPVTLFLTLQGYIIEI